jgi:hypothetical protein
MYTSGTWGFVYAVNAATGKELWRTYWSPPWTWVPGGCDGDVMPINAVPTQQARDAARRVSTARADARAAALAPLIAEIRTSGITAPYAIAAALTARGVPTARGHRFWMVGPVRRLLDRLDRLSAAGNLGVQIESQEGPPKRVVRKPVGRKALLSRSALRSALRELS